MHTASSDMLTQHDQHDNTCMHEKTIINDFGFRLSVLHVFGINTENNINQNKEQILVQVNSQAEG